MKFKKGHYYHLDFDIEFEEENDNLKSKEYHFLIVNGERFGVKYIFSGWYDTEETSKIILVASDVKTIHNGAYHSFFFNFMVVGETNKIHKLHVVTDSKPIFDHEPVPCFI